MYFSPPRLTLSFNMGSKDKYYLFFIGFILIGLDTRMGSTCSSCDLGKFSIGSSCIGWVTYSEGGTCSLTGTSDLGYSIGFRSSNLDYLGAKSLGLGFKSI